MKRHWLILLALVISTMTFSQNTKPEWTKVLDDTPASMNVQLVSSSEENITIRLQVPGFYTTTVTTPNGEANIISVPKSVSTAEAGEPNVPMIGIPAIIGDQARMDVRVVDAKYMDFDNIMVAPSKGDFPRTIDPATVPYTYGDCYNKDAFFPADNAELYEPYILRSYRGQNIAVHPFVYNPVTKTLRVYYDMTVEMYKVDDNGKNPLMSRRSKFVMTDPDFKNVYGRHFINYEASKSKYTPVDEEGDLLIICYDNFISSMTDFVNWKKTRGINTTIVGTSTAGSTYSAIKTYITNQYNANNNLTHVLLVGDVAQIPGYPFTDGGSSWSGKGDNQYGQIVGNDIYNDVFIGRFSASTAARVTTQCNRAITYERDLSTSDTWLQKGLGISASEGSSGHNSEDDYQHIENVRTDLLNYGYSTVYQDYASVSGYPSSSATTISNHINSGVGIINYCNHGEETGWQSHYYMNSNVNALTNENELPFIFSVACLVGKYDHSSDCFAEAWMNATNNNNPTGAISGMFSYISQPWIPPMWAQDEFVDILTEQKNNNIKHTFAGAAINGLLSIFDHYSTSETSAVGTYKAWILYGDPTLMMRTKTPQAMTVTHPSTILLGSSSYSVNVSNGDGALATITDANHNILGKATVSNGTATISISGNLTPGEELTLCVFGYNKVTYLGAVNVIATGEQYNITTNVNNTAWGSVEGAGTYYEHVNCTLTATANHGYAFVNWDDGNTDNPRIITVTGNATYTANFRQLEQHSITYNTQQNHGTISVSPTVAYAGDIVTLTATPDLGYALDHWDVNTVNGNVEVVNNQFVMPDCEVTISATFKSEPITLTVNGTNTTTNSYIPIYGMYADYGTHSQFIISTSDLSEIPAGSTITKLTFYSNKNSQGYFGSKAQVQIGEVSNTSFSSTTFVTSGLTTVISSSATTLTTNASGELEITFETPYTYQGGNLLIGIGGYGSLYASTNWTGVSKSDNVAIYKNNSSSSTSIPSGSGTAVKFAPKTTITYSPSTDPSLSITSNSATVLTGVTVTLTTTTYNVSGTPAITFTSSNNNVATVSGSGNTATVTAVASGTATITATMTYEGETYTATCTITVEDPSYCEPSFSNPSDDYISNFATSGGTTNINNTSTYESSGYSDYYSTQSASIDAGETLSFTVTPSSTSWSYGHAMWVDWNKDYEFTSDERMAYTTSTATGDWTGSFEVPDNTPAGDYRLRVIHLYNSNPTDACMSGQYGEAEDYKLTVLVSSNNCPTPTITDITTTSSTATIITDSEADNFNVRYREFVESTSTTYDFEDGWQGWTAIQGTNGTSPHNWMHNTEYTAYSSNGNVIDLTTSGYNSSEGFMLSESYISAPTSGGTATGAVYPDNYLISPQIRLGGSMTFYASGRTTDCYEKFTVMVSPTTNISDFEATSFTVTLNSQTYTQYTVDLSEYSGMGYVIFHHYDCTDQHLLKIDNVTIVAPSIQWQTANDLTITGLESATTYEVQVQGNCGGEDGVSNWSEVATFTTFGGLELADDDSGDDVQANSALISENANVTTDVMLVGRTLYKDNQWNTICLPFNVTDGNDNDNLTFSGTPLEGAVAKTLVDATMTGTHVTLNFGDAVTTLQAGVPYIIKWENGDNIVNPVFTDVTISEPDGLTISKAGDNVKFIGYYDALRLDPENDTEDFGAADVPNIYYMTSGNTLKHTGVARTLKACRAYFKFSTEVMKRIQQFVLDFGGDVTTGISLTPNPSTNGEGSWYTVDGKKLDQQPTRKGLYIHNGNKVVIK